MRKPTLFDDNWEADPERTPIDDRTIAELREAAELRMAGMPVPGPDDIGNRDDRIRTVDRYGRRVGWTAADLLAHEFPPVPWLVDGLITSGFTCLCGAPKLGKSWMLLQLAYAISVGGAVLGKIKVPKHRVLFLAYEDTGRRLKDRLVKIGATATDNFHCFTDWSRGQEGIDDLRRWMDENPDTKFIAIDTWGRFRRVNDSNDYDQNVEAAAQVKQVADDHDIAVVASHHSSKNPRADGDWLDSLLGSVGLAATIDTGILLRRGRGNRDAELLITGRDVEEQSYALDFDSLSGLWTIEGTTEEIQASKERQEIVDLLNEHLDGMTPAKVAEALEKNRSTVRGLLLKMTNDGTLLNLSGRYVVRETSEIPQTAQTGKQGKPA